MCAIFKVDYPMYKWYFFLLLGICLEVSYFIYGTMKLMDLYTFYNWARCDWAIRVDRFPPLLLLVLTPSPIYTSAFRGATLTILLRECFFLLLFNYSIIITAIISSCCCYWFCCRQPDTSLTCRLIIYFIHISFHTKW